MDGWMDDDDDDGGGGGWIWFAWRRGSPFFPSEARTQCNPRNPRRFYGVANQVSYAKNQVDKHLVW